MARVCLYFFEVSPSLSLLLWWNRRDSDLLLDVLLGIIDFAKVDSMLLSSFWVPNDIALEDCVDIDVKLFTMTTIVRRTQAWKQTIEIKYRLEDSGFDELCLVRQGDERRLIVSVEPDIFDPVFCTKILVLVFLFPYGRIAVWLADSSWEVSEGSNCGYSVRWCISWQMIFNRSERCTISLFFDERLSAFRWSLVGKERCHGLQLFFPQVRTLRGTS